LLITPQVLTLTKAVLHNNWSFKP